MIRILKEPLFHFLLVGLFIVLIFRPSQESNNKIVLSADQQSQIAADLASTLERPPNEDELESAFKQWVEDEVIYREALNLGLDQQDPRIRKRLIDKYRSMIETEVPEPTPEEVRRYYEDHIDQFIKPRRYTLRISEDTTLDKSELRSRLSAYDIGSEYGDKVLSVVKRSPVNEWIGPVLHEEKQIVIQILQIHPADTTSFNEARLFIPTTMKIEALQKAQSESLKSIIDSYTVEYE